MGVHCIILESLLEEIDKKNTASVTFFPFTGRTSKKRKHDRIGTPQKRPREHLRKNSV